MKRERRVGYVQFGGDSAGWKTLSARAHQKLEQRQAMFLGECSESQDCLTGLQRTSPHFERSEEHTSELQSLMRISYAVFCLKKKKKQITTNKKYIHGMHS